MKKIYILYPKKIATIAPEIYGHFTEHIGGVIYGGIWVGKGSHIPNIKGFRKYIVEKLREIKAPVIRWPGGCFAETYDWRDGIGNNRPIRPNWWKNEDGKYETNEVGTHEFMDFCEAVGAKAYFAANLTSTTPMDIRNWMDYCLSPQGTTTLAMEREKNGHPQPFNIPYWGVGNENWGGGGNMTPEYYTNEYRKYSTVMKNTAPNVSLFMCGENGADYHWTNTLAQNLGSVHADGYSMHCYYGHLGNVINFTQKEWYDVLSQTVIMDEIINKNWNIICANNQEDKLKLVIDEWGCWHPAGSGPSKGAKLYEQQSTMRDAMTAALTLNVFNNNCEKIKMANIAQLVNNIHSLFLAEGENCITTPTYHVFNMYKEHQGGEAIELIITDNHSFENSISASASVKDGKTLITICNVSCSEDVKISLEGVGADIPQGAEGILLYNEDIRAYNTFESPDNIAPSSVSIDITKPITIPKAGILAIRF
ncbi:MAG: alpha-N-arabinofuranosidase [Clostridiales bacterium]|nr:alpha-N-arabinofuranosidase [Clostridiales bacterium]